MTVRKILTLALLLVSGMVVGIVVSDRMAARQAAEPAPPSGTADQRGRPAPFPASQAAGLPDLTGVAARAIRASVNISSTSYVRTDPYLQFFYGADPVRPQTSLGSGVVISGDGYVLTNSHVVEGGRDIKITFSDNREATAQTVGADPWTDLALLKVEGAGSIEALPWGDSSTLRVAEWVIAIGNPYSFSQTVTAGIVSALNRPDPQGESFSDFIQTDAAINPGNSGGALVNVRGELVGINTMIFSRTGGYQGIGFAVPSNLARQILEELKTNREIVRGSIGHLMYRPLSVEETKQLQLAPGRGVVIEEMYRGDPAHRAGLLPQDVILSFNGRQVTDPGQLRRAIADTPIGRTVKIEAQRGRRQFEVDVPVIRLANPPPRR
jgi:S1-C subfamily serine protease